MQPVAVALDKMQGEKTAYFGHILPTLHMLVTKLKTMQHKILVYCEPLVVVLLEGLERRFQKELSFSGSTSDKIVAAISHPFFKLRWLPEDKRDSCCELCMQTVRNCEPSSDSSSASTVQTNLEVKDEFLTTVQHQHLMQQSMLSTKNALTT